jgi:hypothetical protein
MRLLIPLMMVSSLLAQQNASLHGSVINTVTQVPVNKVFIHLRLAGELNGLTYLTESKDGGQFSFHNVKPGRYTLIQQKAGFMTPAEGSIDVPRKPLVLEEGQDLEINLKLAPQAVIHGKVTDSDGDPIRHANVSALSYRYLNGRRALNPTLQFTTDDRGEYRIYGVIPGKYYVQASSPGRDVNAGRIDAATFYPGTLEQSEATWINVAAGTDAANIDIRLRKEVVFKVRGSLAPVAPPRNGTDGLEMFGVHNGYTVHLTSSRPKPLTAGGFPVSFRDNDGIRRFEFTGVPAGSYVLIATHSLNGKMLYARDNVEVGGSDVDGLSLTFRPTFDVAGKVVFEGPPTVQFETMRVRLGQSGGSRGASVPLTLLQEDGTFLIHDVPPDLFEISLNIPSTCYIKSVALGTRPQTAQELDLTQGTAAITITLASDFATVGGIVRDAKGEVRPHILVTPIQSGAHPGRVDPLRAVFTNESGHFEFSKIPPGDYQLFAWDKVEPGAPQDPDFRKPYEKQGKALHLGSSSRETIDLVVINVRDQ